MRYTPLYGIGRSAQQWAFMKSEPSRINTRVIFFLLGALAAIGPFSIDMYLPGFPEIARELQVDIAKVSLSLTSFFIGISCGQLIYGPLLDRFGRKIPLLVGLAIYTVAAIGCAYAPNIYWLIGLRLLLALGGCAGMVAGRAIVRDLFPPEETAHAFSMLMLVMGIAPIIAPTIGGYVVASFGWRTIFFVLASFGVFLFAAVFILLPESNQGDKSLSLQPHHIICSYFSVFKNPRFLAYGLCGGFTGAGLFAYISGSPFVFMKLFHTSEQTYGWIFGFNAFGLILASQVSRFVLRRLSSQRIVLIVTILQSITALFLIGLTITGTINLALMVTLLFLYLFFQGFIYPNTSALALEPFYKNIGAASALIGFLHMMLNSIVSALVSYFHNETALPMTSMIATCSSIGLGALLFHYLVFMKRTVPSPMTS